LHVQAAIIAAAGTFRSLVQPCPAGERFLLRQAAPDAPVFFQQFSFWRSGRNDVWEGSGSCGAGREPVVVFWVFLSDDGQSAALTRMWRYCCWSAWSQSLFENYAGCCGEGFWLWPRRQGRSIPAAGGNDRPNAGHGQKTRRPEGFQQKAVWLRCSSVEDPRGIWDFPSPAIFVYSAYFMVENFSSFNCSVRDPTGHPSTISNPILVILSILSKNLSPMTFFRDLSFSA
jgi:hypothetical protein